MQEAFRECLLSGEITALLVNKIFRKSLFEMIRFPVDEVYEDVAVFYKLFDKCKLIAHTGTVEYYYRKRVGSITFTNYAEIFRFVSKNCNDLTAFLTEKYPALVPVLGFYEAEVDYYLISKYLQIDGDTRTPIYKELKSRLLKDLPMVRKHPRWSMAKKMKIGSILIGLYVPLRSAYYFVMSRF